MKKYLIIFLLIAFCFCTACNSDHHKTDSDIIPDEDLLIEDTDISDDLSDDLSDEVSDTESEDTEPDEIPDIVYPEPTCIEIYEGDPESKLCFGPVKTDVKCNAFPKDGEFVTVLEDDNPIGKIDSPMDINDDFVFFTVNPKDKSRCFEEYTYCPDIYGCNRLDSYLYEIVTSKFIHNVFSVEFQRVVFAVSDETKISNKLYMGNLTTNELTELKEWGDDGFGKLQLKYPFLTYTDGYFPYIFNLETNKTEELSRLSGPFPMNDGKNLVLGGRYSPTGGSFSDSPFGVSTWIVNLETLEIRPLNVTASLSEGVVSIEGDSVFVESGRDLIHYENSPMQWSGFDIYSFNMKTKREEKWTPEIKGIFEGNSIRPSFEYPYFHYVSNETDETYGGGSFALNIETGVVTPFWEGTGDQWCYIKDRYVLLGGYYHHGIAKLPDLPRLPENADVGCEDNNVCTDNRYFVTDGKCHFIPNHERCDDKDDSTLLDVCIEGSCYGYAGTGTTEEMVKITAGKFKYDGLEFETKVSFMMDVFEVTNSDYEKCVEAKACVPPLRSRSLTVLDYYGNPLYDNYPVLYVNQYEAQVYCNWLGKRLPTEFEWMKAAWDGEEKTYLWGEEKPDYETYPASFYANTGTGYPGFVGFDTVEAGTFPADKTVSGIWDMSGNVQEWTTSEWTYDLCVTPPCVGYFGSDLVVAKGGGYLTGPELKTRHPYTPWTHSFFTGFRCVKSVKPVITVKIEK